MSALHRVAALYRLLERVRESEALAANAEVALADAKIQHMAAKRQKAIEDAQQCVDDPVARATSTQMLESCGVLTSRLQALRAQQVEVQRNAMAELALSRLQVRQVEITLEHHWIVEEAASLKRAQALEDERYLIQRYRSPDAGHPIK